MRPRSALGLKYVEITRGQSRESYEDGDTIPLAQAETPVELDEFLNMFDEETRAASQANLEGFGTAFAGRGESINTAIGAFRPLLRDIVPVMQNLSAPETNLDRFITELGDDGGDRRAGGGDAGVAVPQPGHDDGRARRGRAARTSRTRSTVRPAGAGRRHREPPAPAAVPGQHRGPDASSCSPASARCKTAAPALSDALGAGIEVLPKTPPLNRRLESLLRRAADVLQRPAGPARHPLDHRAGQVR